MNINAGSISSLLSVASFLHLSLNVLKTAFKEQLSSAHLQGASGFLGIPGLVGTPGLKVKRVINFTSVTRPYS